MPSRIAILSSALTVLLIGPSARLAAQPGVLLAAASDSAPASQHTVSVAAALDTSWDDICTQPPGPGEWVGALVGASVGELLLIEFALAMQTPGPLAASFGGVGALAGLGATARRPCPDLLPYALNGGVVGSWASLAMLSTVWAQEETGRVPGLAGSKASLFRLWLTTALPASLGAMVGMNGGVRVLKSAERGRGGPGWTFALTGGRTRVAGWPRRRDGWMWAAAVGRLFPFGKRAVFREELRYLDRRATLEGLAVGYGMGTGVRKGDWHMDFRSVQIPLLVQTGWGLHRGISVSVAGGLVFSATIGDEHRTSRVQDYPLDHEGTETPSPNCWIEDEPEELLIEYSGVEAELRVGLWGSRLFAEAIWNFPLYGLAPAGYPRACARRYWSGGLAVGVRW